MKEQSHKDEMSAALRGDFQRLRERGVTTTLSPGETEDLDTVEIEPEVVEPERPPGWLGRLLGR